MSFSIFSGDVTTITIFSFILSLTSIVSSTFEYISLQYLLQTETILSITFYIESIDIAQMKSFDFKQLTNYKRGITKELSKYFEINYHVIEILRPIQTSNGINITFHIRVSNSTSIKTSSSRSVSGGETENHRILKMVHDNEDKVCQMIFNKWKSRFPKFCNQAKVINVQSREMRASGSVNMVDLSTDSNTFKHDGNIMAVSDETQTILHADTDDDDTVDNDAGHEMVTSP